MAQLYGALAAVLGPDPGRALRALPFGANADAVHRRLLIEDSDEVTLTHLRTVARLCGGVDPTALNALHARRRAAALAVRPGQSVRAVAITPCWRMVVGHGENTATETSLTLSPTHGLPILPGSALKGLAAAQARVTAPQRIGRLFGAPRPGTGTDEPAMGAVVFLDAFPLTPPTVVVDTLAPHVPPYYNSGNSTGVPDRPPAEYHNPVPVRFLAVAATPFEALLIGPDAEVTQAADLLATALDELGIGGKTAAGYGYCTAEITALSAEHAP
ncbi:type III-B CRISPR module RAMP protein Cmr6 [Kutzneria buriramensis]|uniref:CRISPR-associated protein Cmr6 n=1 Tax=Kutzneria buriramensis TaxID=1045776 RepID=A0A3E0HLJ8_9PSEU|nr:type III-B CRISPR module RAMP protein Cmr6 [Kutzneria buriramensis]REH47344.1 CRISPR-associated protein Cmr6 [Kutzneria buriramensis]